MNGEKFCGGCGAVQGMFAASGGFASASSLDVDLLGREQPKVVGAVVASVVLLILVVHCFDTADPS